MSALRVARKLVAIAWVCGTSVLWMLGVRALRPGGREGRAQRENRVSRSWARRMCRVLGVRIRVEGPKPEPPFLLVSNHLSYVDVVVLMSQLDARLVSKAEVRSWPLLGALARLGGTLFIDRTKRRDIPRVLADIQATLARGHGVVFFPEGTSSAGLEVMPFKASLFEAAALGSLEIVPASLHYATPPDERPAQWSVAWWGDMDFAPHLLGLLRLSRIDAVLRLGTERLQDDDRKQLALAAHGEVASLFHPLCSELGEDRPAARA